MFDQAVACHLADEQAEAVADLLAAGQPSPGRHRLDPFRPDDIAGAERHRPAHQVENAGAERSRGEGQVHGQRLVVQQDAVLDPVALGAVGHDRVVVEVVRLPHAERPEERLLEVLRVRLAARLLDQQAGQVVAGVVVLVTVPRLELPGLGGEQLDHLLVGEVEPPLLPERRHLGVALDAARVVEQLPYRDVELADRVVGEVLRHRLVQGDAALLDQLHHRRRRELLGHRPDPVDGVLGRRHPVLDVGQAVAAGQDQLAAVLDRDRDAGRLRGLHRFRDQVIDSLEQGAAVVAGGRRRH